MPPRSSRRLGPLVQSDIRRMTRECERVGGINLGQGLCDLPTPPAVREGASRALREGRSSYSVAEGTLELRRAIARKLARHNSIQADPEGEIVVTVGATGAFTATLHALLDPGQGILLLEPYYGYHLHGARLAGLVPAFLPLEPPGFLLERAPLEAALDAAPSPVRALVLCTPSNPSGRMLTRPELELAADVARARDLLVITDEIYEHIRYDGREHLSPTTVADLAERTVTIQGLSKTFSVTGWRLGYAVAPRALAEPIALANDLFYVCAPTPLQLGAAEGLRAPDSFFAELADGYARRRALLCGAVERAGLAPIVPEGAYYVLADARALGPGTARERALRLLERTGVAAIPGTAFFRGAAGEDWLRFCFAKEEPLLAEACARLERLAPAEGRA